ncbi:mechanosensitive ion channel [Capnocytophaga genosp. AHN8471]|jgi:mscS mechanosensitive ion channel|uniref:mechanosensitive ion channel family protein n=1 Tax=Capnocytophaga genosp. AHN8471 TaxID=327574 RepID=UPI0019348231|nr:mechanosensitive ion channel domain-containing protein [Capnocytophaga genosp. AHN8471]MBM0653638.1 mechanosensitive ion channel [Capnocytophaga genosp. AHN8471]
MHFKIFIVIYLFCVAYTQAQQPDSLSQQEIHKELEAIKQFRQKDSVRIAMLLNEIQLLINNDKHTSSITNSSTTNEKEMEKLRNKMRGRPIVFEKDTLYYLYTSYGPYDIDTRVKYIENKLKELYNDPSFAADSIKIKPNGDYLSVMYNEKIITRVTMVDALWENSSQTELAQRYANVIKNTIVKYKEQNSLKSILIRLAELLLVLFIAFVLVWAINRLFNFLKKITLNSEHRSLTGIRIRNYEFIKKRGIVKALVKLLAILRIIFLLFLLITIIPLIFDIFPSTQYLSKIIVQWISEPIKNVGIAIIGYLPHLFYIVIIVVITRYVLKILRFFALEIERGILKIKGFHPEWAHTTYVLARMMLWVLALVIMFPHLPGSDSDAFKGISVFLGVLISLGSSSAISNAIADIVISYMRPFQVGDWIKSGEIIGAVIEKNALVTRLKTINNEDITIPNSAILSGATMNFTSIGKEIGLALNVQVKVRYDYSDNLVEELLIEAALKTNGISPKPHPYIFQISLNELNAIYELNAYTFHPENMYFIKSDLTKNIQSTFRQANVEIFSTQYVEIKTPFSNTKKQNS